MTTMTGMQARKTRTAKTLSAFIDYAARQGLVVDDDGMTLYDALVGGGLNYRVETASLLAEQATPRGVETVPMETHRAVLRVNPDGTKVGLSVVQSRYATVQNTDAFAFLQTLIDNREADLVAVSAYGLVPGQQAFVAMHLPEPMLLADSEEVLDVYLVARNSHDGNSKFTVAVVPVRADGSIVETNIPRYPQQWAMTHSGNVANKLNDAITTMRRVEEWQTAYQRVSSRMLSTPLSSNDFARIVRALLPTPAGASDRSADEWAKRRRSMENLFDKAPKQNFGAGTVYAGFAAVCSWVDLHAPGKVDAAAARQSRIINGTAAKMKRQAWDMLSRHN